MKLAPLLPSLGVVALLAIAGCGGGGDTRSPTVVRTSPPAGRQQDDAAALKQSVRSAVQQNARLSTYVLWNNAVPSWAARSTGGPALRALQRSATGRRAKGVRVRSLSQRVEIISVRLDPSYLAATAKVRESGRVVPYRHGRRLGRSVRLDEIARVELRRVGNSARFRVWEVARAS